MTLTEALRRLHEAGRVRSPWQVGMSWSGLLVVEVVAGPYAQLREALHPCEVRQWSIDEAVRDGLSPDTDGATTGCLLALLREAHGNPHIHVEPEDRMEPGSDWTVYAPEPGAVVSVLGWSRTEGAAIVVALVALAEGL